jgi:hypothetical protein
MPTPKSVRLALLIAVGALCLALAPAALAAHGGGRTPSTGSSTLSLVPMNSTDGLPHYGQQVTFNVSTTVTSRPYVTLECSQGGALVYSNQVGYYPDYPWVQYFTLASDSWHGGDAGCKATLEYWSGKRWTPLTSMTFTARA